MFCACLPCLFESHCQVHVYWNYWAWHVCVCTQEGPSLPLASPPSCGGIMSPRHPPNKMWDPPAAGIPLFTTCLSCPQKGFILMTGHTRSWLSSILLVACLRPSWPCLTAKACQRSPQPARQGGGFTGSVSHFFVNLLNVSHLCMQRLQHYYSLSSVWNSILCTDFVSYRPVFPDHQGSVLPTIWLIPAEPSASVCALIWFSRLPVTLR